MYQISQTLYKVESVGLLNIEWKFGQEHNGKTSSRTDRTEEGRRRGKYQSGSYCSRGRIWSLFSDAQQWLNNRQSFQYLRQTADRNPRKGNPTNILGARMYSAFLLLNISWSICCRFIRSGTFSTWEFVLPKFQLFIGGGSSDMSEPPPPPPTIGANPLICCRSHKEKFRCYKSSGE